MNDKDMAIARSEIERKLSGALDRRSRYSRGHKVFVFNNLDLGCEGKVFLDVNENWNKNFSQELNKIIADSIRLHGATNTLFYLELCEMEGECFYKGSVFWEKIEIPIGRRGLSLKASFGDDQVEELFSMVPKARYALELDRAANKLIKSMEIVFMKNRIGY